MNREGLASASHPRLVRPLVGHARAAATLPYSTSFLPLCCVVDLPLLLVVMVGFESGRLARTIWFGGRESPRFIRRPPWHHVI